MAPTASTMNPTLQMDKEDTAGARAGGPEAGKRQKTEHYKISNNFACCNPARDAREAGNTSPSVVPSDDEDIPDGEKKLPRSRERRPTTT